MATLTHPAREANRVDTDTRIDVRVPEKFTNEPMIDWSNPEHQRRMRAAIEKVRNELGREYDLVIGGRRVKTAKKHESINPAHPSQVVGLHQEEGVRDLEPDSVGDAHESSVPRRAVDARAPLRADGMAGFRGGEELGRGRCRYR